jgi:phospholipase C
MAGGIQHIFVLMLENRSFDHMLGFSGITGTDAESGNPTLINGFSPLSLRLNANSFQTNSLRGIVNKKAGQKPHPLVNSVRQLLTSNLFGGLPQSATQPADFVMPVDPGHEFSDVLNQLADSAPSTRTVALIL